MIIVKAASEQNVNSQIFRPTTTARLQVVAIMSLSKLGGNGACSKFVGGNEDNVKLMLCK